MRPIPRRQFLRRCPRDLRESIKEVERATGNYIRIFEKPSGEIVFDYSTPPTSLTVKEKP